MADANQSVRRELERWRTDVSDSAAWDARKLVRELRSDGHADLAVEFGERATAQWPMFEPLRSELAWSLHYRDIRPVDPETASRDQRRHARDALERIRALSSAEPYGRYSAWPHAVLGVAKLVGGWPEAALAILDEVEPWHLSSEISGVYPSMEGRWYLAATHALQEMRDWSEQLRRCTMALDGASLRVEDSRLIRRRKAIALEHLQRFGEAADLLRSLQAERGEWWVDADLARTLAAMGHTDEAIRACRGALAKPADLKMKWKTVVLLAELLENADPDLAQAHFQLARSLRLGAGWRPDPHLEKRAAAAGISGVAPTRVDLAPILKTWRDVPDPSRSIGTIKAVLQNGQSGFLARDDGTDFYFAMPRNSSEPAPPAGTRVSFRVVDGFDKKKNQPSKRAVDLRLA